MATVNHPAFLLFIEPDGAATAPIVDVYTLKITAAFRRAKAGIAGYSRSEPRFCEQGAYKGMHMCDCGKASSSNCDYFISAPEGSPISIVPDQRAFSEGNMGGRRSRTDFSRTRCASITSHVIEQAYLRISWS